MPRTAIHPGEHLAEELSELGMSAAELARRLAVPTNRLTSILNGRRAITGDTALRLAHFFGTSAEFWLNLQNLYDLRLAERKSGKSIRKLPTLKRAKVRKGAERPLVTEERSGLRVLRLNRRSPKATGARVDELFEELP